MTVMLQQENNISENASPKFVAKYVFKIPNL